MSPNVQLREAARKLKLGRAALTLYHRPVGLFLKSVAEGGPFEQRRTEQGRRAMMQAAASIPPLTPPSIDRGAKVTFLSGADYWYQTLFCLVSFQIHTFERITPIIFDDGSFTNDTKASVRRVIPWVEFIDYAVIQDHLDRLLPASSFPTLRARRLSYFHLRKLTDIHIAAAGWTLVFDSDMLIFRRPNAVIDWFRSPCPLFMVDVASAYGYPDEIMQELAGRPVPARVNVGLYALHGPSVDWDRVEYWCREQVERHGPHYLQEQALTALLLAKDEVVPLPASEYVVMPNLLEGRAPTAVLHHYVAHSKRSYFQYGWRRVADQLGLAA